jgi:hypothetical protein
LSFAFLETSPVWILLEFLESATLRRSLGTRP